MMSLCSLLKFYDRLFICNCAGCVISKYGTVILLAVAGTHQQLQMTKTIAWDMEEGLNMDSITVDLSIRM
jgi:hypothetical protein